MNASIEVTKEKSAPKRRPAEAEKASDGDAKLPTETGWQSLTALREDIDRIIENAATSWPWVGHPFDVRPWTHLSASLGLTSPASDVVETDKNYLISIELPGIAREDIEVDLSGEMLSVRAEKSEEHTEEKEKYRWSERRYGSIERSFRLPKGVDDTKIKASHTDGVLRLTLPKTKKAKKKQRKVDVTAK